MGDRIGILTGRPLLSIIVPVYNVEEYLDKCIESILRQNYRNFELILVNDGSTDSSFLICKKYESLDSRIVTLSQANKGLSSARNAGLEYANGAYIGFVDSDDWIEPTMYENLVAACLEESADISCCGRRMIYSPSNTKELFNISEREVWTPEECLSRLFSWDGIDSSACDKVFKASLFRKVKYPVGELHEDIMIMYRLISNSDKIVHSGTCEYNYRQHMGSITRSDFTLKKMKLLDTLYEIFDFVKNNYPSIEASCAAFALVNVDMIIYSFVESNGGKPRYKEQYSILKKSQSYFSKYAIASGRLSSREHLKYYLSKYGFERLYVLLKRAGLRWRFRHGT